MKKIKTIFDRDWEGKRGVINKYVNTDADDLKCLTPTEKLDGTNVRLTIRNHQVVRIEKRRNPNKKQKAQDIKEPWYVDADEFSPQDKYLFEAVKNRDYNDIDDGEWSGEAVGPKIQGNPLNLEKHTICLFSCEEAPILENVPTTFEGLKEWLPKQKSKFGNDCGIEGIVWHYDCKPIFKIKCKDFK